MTNAPAPQKTIVFYLMPEFTMIAFTAAIEPLRGANRVLGYEAYKWRLVSKDGGTVTASNGVEVRADTSIDDERKLMLGEKRPSIVFVCGGLNIERYHSKSLSAWLREEHNRGVKIGGLCTGAHTLGAAGLLNNKRCAIHWENLPGFQEAFPQVSVFSDLFEIDGNVYTCAGGTAALDMMLKIIGDDGRVEFIIADIAIASGDGIWVAGLPPTATIITVGQGFVPDGAVVNAIPEGDVDTAVASQAEAD